MSYLYRLALAHREELLRQAAQRGRAHQAIRAREAPAIPPTDAKPIKQRVLRLARSATQG